MIKSYCKKDKCVEAIQWNGSNIYEVSRFLKKNVTACFDGSYVRVDGVLGEIGCYITVNDKGIFGLYSKKNFEENYIEINLQDEK